MRFRNTIMSFAALTLALAFAATPGIAATQDVAAPAVAIPPVDAAEMDGDIKDALICAGCIVGGIVAVASGTAEAAAITLVVGGAGAVAIGSAVTACMVACYEALT